MRTNISAVNVHTPSVLMGSVFKSSKDGAYYTVEKVESVRVDASITVRRAPIGSTRRMKMSKFLDLFVWAGTRANILPQMA